MSQSEGKNDEAPGQNITIYVNGRPKEVHKGELTFDEVLDLAFGDPKRGPNIVFTVTYKRGKGKKPEGTMVQGDTVKVKAEMIFNVTRTDKS